MMRIGRTIVRTDKHGTYEDINQDDPFWIGYYDAEQPGTVTRPLHLRTVLTDPEDRARWRAGAMRFHRERRERNRVLINDLVAIHQATT